MKIGFKVLILGVGAITPLLLCGCGGSGSGAKIVSPPPITNIKTADFILTTPDKTNLLKEQAKISASSAANNDNVIVIDDTKEYQSFIGVGAAITDASAHLIQNSLNAQKRDEVLNELFGDNGLGLDFTRLTIGASDFSITHYSLNDMPKGQSDIGMEKFSLSAMPKEVLPTIKAAKAINPSLSIMASPWSAPNWMKTTDSMIGGTLRPEYYEAFANYFVKYDTEMAKEGISIDYVSIQNEPHFSPTNYPGMKLDPKMRADFVKNHLGPKFAKIENAPKILEWDHNWDEPQSPTEVLNDKDANKYFDGIAWHCYAGDVSAQSKVQAQFPDKNVYFTECSGGEWAKDWNDAFAWQVDNLIIGSTRNWAKGVLLWNIALDEKFGPHLGGCGNCRGVLTINSQNGEISRNLEYYALGHISKYVMLGAKRIESNSGKNGINNVAFKNPNGSIVVIAVNNAKTTQNFSIEIAKNFYNVELTKGAAATLIIK